MQNPLFPGGYAFVLAVFALLGVVSESPGAGLLLNEILYDPEGPDTGREWIELHNDGPWPAPTEGLVLEFANGAVPGVWTVVWEGTEGGWVEPGAFFVVGERDGLEVDSPARLGLQNGPDALRLVRDGFVLDLVGWGEPLEASLAEGTPALLAPSGSSLGRVDGVDTNDNRADFQSRAPSPGRANLPSIDLAVSLVPTGGRQLPVETGRPWIRAGIRLQNLGRMTIPLSGLDCTLLGNRVQFRGDSLAAGAEVLEPVEALGLPRGETAILTAHLRLPGDGNVENDVDTLAAALLPSPVRLTEIYPRPRPGSSEVEWVELEAGEPVRLAEWRVEDWTGGAVRMLPEDSLLAGIFVLSPPGGPGTVDSEGWPSLNDRASGLGVADTLFVIDSDGRVRDWAVYGEADPGTPWIRIAGPPLADPRDLWVPDPGVPGGTPGVPSVGATTGSLWPLSEGVSLAAFPAGAWIDLPTGSRSYSLDVYDLRGRRVRRSSGPVRGERIRWDGRDSGGTRLVGGVYLLDLRAETNRGPYSERLTLVLDR